MYSYSSVLKLALGFAIFSIKLSKNYKPSSNLIKNLSYKSKTKSKCVNNYLPVLKASQNKKILSEWWLRISKKKQLEKPEKPDLEKNNLITPITK